MAKALRNIPKLMGKSYNTGDEIPAAVIAQMTPQTMQALVNSRAIEVDGVDPKGGGVSTHLAAKVDQHHDRLKKVEAAHAGALETIAALEKRLVALEGGNTAKPAKATKAKA